MKEKIIDTLTKQIKNGKFNNSILRIKINKNGHIEYVEQSKKVNIDSL